MYVRHMWVREKICYESKNNVSLWKIISIIGYGSKKPGLALQTARLSHWETDQMLTVRLPGYHTLRDCQTTRQPNANRQAATHCETDRLPGCQPASLPGYQTFRLADCRTFKEWHPDDLPDTCVGRFFNREVVNINMYQLFANVSGKEC